MDWMPHLDRIRTMIAEGKSVADVMAEFGATRHCVESVAYRHKLGKFKRTTGPRPDLRRKVPDDFVENYAKMPFLQLRAHYGAGRKNIERWIEATGVDRIQYPLRSQAKRKPGNFTQIGARRVDSIAAGWRQTLGKDPFVRDMSAAGQAADYLRKWGPVTRCNEDGRFNGTGRFYRIGSTILNEREIVERAEDRKRRMESRAA